jgi:hypothetical protein
MAWPASAGPPSRPLAWHIPVDAIVKDEEAEHLRESAAALRETRVGIPRSGRAIAIHTTSTSNSGGSKPRIGADFILFDEAQDADG